MLYVAYGSNLDIQQMHFRCPTAIPIGPIRIHNAGLTFRGVADVELIPGRSTYGGLWDIQAADERALDSYEGFPNLYTKHVIKLEDGRKAMIYVMTWYGAVRKGYRAPPHLYLSTVVRGYRYFNLPLKHLQRSLVNDAHSYTAPDVKPVPNLAPMTAGAYRAIFWKTRRNHNGANSTLMGQVGSGQRTVLKRRTRSARS